MNKEQICILIVDDEEDIQELVQFQLEDEGYKVLTASSGNEGFQLFQNNDIQLIVSDVRMPNGDGVEFLDKVSKIKMDPPYFYFMTGFADISKDESLAKGARGFFSKPFNLDEFTKEINNCVEANLLK